ncbi:MAG: hypothetical protein LBF84_04105 [Holosporales bacterium]|nr:hypothetical protein [Holosporales bacterium]
MVESRLHAMIRKAPDIRLLRRLCDTLEIICTREEKRNRTKLLALLEAQVWKVLRYLSTKQGMMLAVTKDPQPQQRQLDETSIGFFMNRH